MHEQYESEAGRQMVRCEDGTEVELVPENELPDEYQPGATWSQNKTDENVLKHVGKLRDVVLVGLTMKGDKRLVVYEENGVVRRMDEASFRVFYDWS